MLNFCHRDFFQGKETYEATTVSWGWKPMPSYLGTCEGIPEVHLGYLKDTARLIIQSKRLINLSQDRDLF